MAKNSFGEDRFLFKIKHEMKNKQDHVTGWDGKFKLAIVYYAETSVKPTHDQTGSSYGGSMRCTRDTLDGCRCNPCY